VQGETALHGCGKAEATQRPVARLHCSGLQTSVVQLTGFNVQVYPVEVGTQVPGEQRFPVSQTLLVLVMHWPFMQVIGLQALPLLGQAGVKLQFPVVLTQVSIVQGFPSEQTGGLGAGTHCPAKHSKGAHKSVYGQRTGGYSQVATPPTLAQDTLLQSPMLGQG
jgi:hypothetical protein